MIGIVFFSIVLLQHTLYAYQEPMLDIEKIDTTTQTKIFCGYALQISQEQGILTPAKITESGVYCMVENITLRNSTGLLIDADNVILDLNGYVLAGESGTSNAITIARDRIDITIRNGTIKTMLNNAIFVNGGTKRVKIQNIKALQNKNNGIVIQGAESFIITNCIAESNTNTGIVIAESSSLLNENLVIKNCISIANGFHGFELISCSRLSIFNSLAFNNQASGFREIRCDSVAFWGCLGHNNIANGFVMGTNQASAGSDHRFNQCNANTNGNAGFLIRGNRQNLEECQAQSNIAAGFQLGGNNHTIFNCVAQNNVTGILLATDSNQCQVRSNTTLGNITGLQNSAVLPSINRIYSNFSSNNTTNFVGVPAANIAISPVAATAINFTANIDN